MDSRNVFGVVPSFVPIEHLRDPKEAHTGRVRADPARDQPAMTVHHRR